MDITERIMLGLLFGGSAVTIGVWIFIAKTTYDFFRWVFDDYLKKLEVE